MNSLCLSGIVKVDAAHHNADMRPGPMPVPTDEVQPVVADEDAVLLYCEGKHIVVVDLAVSIAGFERSQHIMPERTKGLDDLQLDILIRVKAGHVDLRSFVLVNLSIYGVGMRPGVSPRVLQILSANRGIAGEQRFFGSAKAPGLLQNPDRNSCPHDAGFAAAHVGPRIDARKSAA